MGRAQLKQDLRNADEAWFAKRAHQAYEVLFQGKWRVQVLCAMRHGPVRLGQLQRLVPGASKKMLSQCLRRMEADRIVTRHDFSDVVLHVEYELCEDVKSSVGEVLECLAQWGSEYVYREKPKRPTRTGANFETASPSSCVCAPS